MTEAPFRPENLAALQAWLDELGADDRFMDYAGATESAALWDLAGWRLGRPYLFYFAPPGGRD